MKNGQVTFNALECVKHLRNVGFTQEQAEAQALEIEKAKADLESNLATKDDFKREILATRNDLKREIAELNSTLTFRIVCVVGIASGLLGTLITILKFVPL